MLRRPLPSTHDPACRFCGAKLEVTVVDLGMSPLCESFVRPSAVGSMEPFYPLHVRACTRCWLVQLPELVAPEEIFTEYAYFSGFSTSWVEHARRYVETIRERLELGPDDLVVELASNDGYLLQHVPVNTELPLFSTRAIVRVVAQSRPERPLCVPGDTLHPRPGRSSE